MEGVHSSLDGQLHNIEVKTVSQMTMSQPFIHLPVRCGVPSVPIRLKPSFGRPGAGDQGAGGRDGDGENERTAPSESGRGPDEAISDPSTSARLHRSRNLRVRAPKP